MDKLIAAQETKAEEDLAKAEEEKAAALAKAEEEKAAVADEIIELEKAAAAAGQRAVTGAAVSFKNKMFSIEKGIEDIKDKKTQLRDKERASSDAYIENIATGKTTGSSTDLNDALQELKDYVRGIEKKGPNHKLTKGEALKISRLQTEIERSASQAGLGDINAIKILEQISPKLADKFSKGGGVMGIENIIKAHEINSSLLNYVRGILKKGPNHKLTYEEALGISRLRTEIERAASIAGLGDINATKILKEFSPKLADKLGQGGGVVGIENRRNAASDGSALDKKFGKGSFAKLRDINISEKEAIGELDTAQADLAKQLEVTKP